MSNLLGPFLLPFHSRRYPGPSPVVWSIPCPPGRAAAVLTSLQPVPCRAQRWWFIRNPGKSVEQTREKEKPLLKQFCSRVYPCCCRQQRETSRAMRQGRAGIAADKGFFRYETKTGFGNRAEVSLKSPEDIN